MKKLFVILGLAMLGMSAQAKDYKYETVNGDLMNSRIYTLDMKCHHCVLKDNPEQIPGKLRKEIARQEADAERSLQEP